MKETITILFKMIGTVVLLLAAWFGIIFVRVHFPNFVQYAYTLPMDILGICITLGTILLVAQFLWKHWKQSKKIALYDKRV